MSYMTDVSQKMASPRKKKTYSTSMQAQANNMQEQQGKIKSLKSRQTASLKTQYARSTMRPSGMQSTDPSSLANQRKSMIRTAIKAGTDGTKNSASVKNTNKKSPRYGQYYTVQPGKGGNYHVYGNGKRVFVRSKKHGLNINRARSIHAKKFNPKQGLHHKEYLINA